MARSLVDFTEGNLLCYRGSVFAGIRVEGAVVLSGSFNPLHAGHIQLLSAAQQLVGSAKGLYELSICNADKGWISEEEVKRRVVGIAGPVLLTTTGEFIDKCMWAQK